MNSLLNPTLKPLFYCVNCVYCAFVGSKSLHFWSPLVSIIALTGVFYSTSPAAESTLNPSLQETKLIHIKDDPSQKKADQSRKTSDPLLQQYRQLTKDLQQLDLNHSQMTQIHKQQQESVRSLEAQLTQVSETEDSIVPLLFSMIDWLDQRLADDLPFHPQERRQRIDRLKLAIIAPDLTLTDRYRQVLDAYQIESEYGYTIDSYSDTIDFNGEPRIVNILRIGRIGLYFESLDGSDGGRWDERQGGWVAVSNEAMRNIRQGILIARKQRPQTLLTLPVTAR